MKFVHNVILVGGEFLNPICSGGVHERGDSCIDGKDIAHIIFLNLTFYAARPDAILAHHMI